MDLKNKSKTNRLKFVISVLLFLLFMYAFFNTYYYFNDGYGKAERILLLCKSLYPDKRIELNSLKLTLEQPFFFGKRDSTKNQDIYKAFHEFGIVYYRVLHVSKTFNWKKHAISFLEEFGYEDICNVLYEYSTSEGPVYLLFNIDGFNYDHKFETGYNTMAVIFIPHKRLSIDVYKTREDVEFFLEFAKPFISDDPDIKPELVGGYCGGEQEW